MDAIAAGKWALESILCALQLSHLFIVAVLLYDFVLTFPQEVGWLWRGWHLSIARTLFIINRYLPIIALVPAVFEDFASNSIEVNIQLSYMSTSSYVLL